MKIKQDKPYLTALSDFTYVIVGEHLTVEEANRQFGEEYSRESDTSGGIVGVKHYWMRYEFIGEDNCPDEMDPEDFGKGEGCWVLKEQTKRPKGATVKVTVVC